MLKGVWDRRLPRRVPKRNRRAEVYEPFAVYFIANRDMGADDGSSNAALDLNKINSRLVVFGESEVVKASSTFLIDTTP